MPYEDIAAETDSMQALSGGPSGEPMPGPEPGGPPMQEPGMQAPTGGMGGPGIDTPQEQQAVQMLTQGAQALRQAADTDPSIRYIIDKALKDTFLAITKHYGLEQEGKAALQQAELQANRERSQNVMPSGGPQGPPGAPVA